MTELQSSSQGTRALSSQQCCCWEQVWNTMFFKEEETMIAKEEEKLQKVKNAYFQQLPSHHDAVTMELMQLQFQTNKACQEIQSKYQHQFNRKDHRQRYEKYGSRANFIRDRNTELLARQ